MILYAYCLGKGFCHGNAFFFACSKTCGATPAFISAIPKFHCDADYAVPLLFKQERRYAGVNAARKSYRNVHSLIVKYEVKCVIKHINGFADILFGDI